MNVNCRIRGLFEGGLPCRAFHFGGGPKRLERGLSTLLTAILIALPIPGTAEPAAVFPCLRQTVMDEALRDNYREEAVAAGVSADGTLMRMFVGPAGTYTVTKTAPNGISCIVDAGDGWEALAPSQAWRRHDTGGQPRSRAAP